MYGLVEDTHSKEIIELQKQILALQGKIQELQKQRPPRLVENHSLTDWDGRSVTVADLFGDKSALIVVHNMGFGCPYCTMWADGFNGVIAHIEKHAAFVVVSPDTVEQQKAGASARGWKMKMLSAHGSEFTKALGFQSDGGFLPGCSTFGRDATGNVFLHAQTPFGPGDRFCSVWGFTELLPPPPPTA